MTMIHAPTMTAAPATPPPEVGRPIRLDLRDYDFLDFGCSDKGSSMAFAAEVFGGAHGLGLDLDPAKVSGARARGHQAEIADLTAPMKMSGRVRFVQMIHFLEHLRSAGDAKLAIHNAVGAARGFVVIRQPWFDADGYLASLGMKFFWSDWRGHANHMTTLHLASILRELRTRSAIRRFSIHGFRRLQTSAGPDILPLSAPRDQFGYDAETHGPKRTVEFAIPVYRELLAVAVVGEEPQEGLTRFLKGSEPVVDSRSLEA